MPLHAATIFLSAFLLFLVQPILAKQILPWFGGAAIVWTMCMVFFQLVLLLGYLYVHEATTRLRRPVHLWVHAVVILLPLAVLPVTVPTALGQGGSPELRLLAHAPLRIEHIRSDFVPRPVCRELLPHPGMKRTDALRAADVVIALFAVLQLIAKLQRPKIDPFGAIEQFVDQNGSLVRSSIGKELL